MSERRRNGHDPNQQQFPGWDAAEGARRRDEAMRQVAEHADAGWNTVALNAVRYCAERYAEVETDIVWGVLDHYSIPGPHERRAIGPVMKNAQVAGWITPTGQFRKSERPDCHRRPIAVYRSLLYQDDPW